jgi:hypothetical protein
VKSDLKEVAQGELELKNKRCWEGKRYYLALFTIRVIIGPADLKFELVSSFSERFISLFRTDFGVSTSISISKVF